MAASVLFLFICKLGQRVDTLSYLSVLGKIYWWKWANVISGTEKNVAFFSLHFFLHVEAFSGSYLVSFLVLCFCAIFLIQKCINICCILCTVQVASLYPSLHVHHFTPTPHHSALCKCVVNCDMWGCLIFMFYINPFVLHLIIVFMSYFQLLFLFQRCKRKFSKRFFSSRHLIKNMRLIIRIQNCLCLICRQIIQ
jgi:hypothetical protein